MEKCNVVEPIRTPCKKKSGEIHMFCGCPECTKDLRGQKQAEEQPVSIDDTEGLARIHA